MDEKLTPAGRVRIGPREDLFRHALDACAQAADPENRDPAVIALSGGSTPQAWYRWCTDRQPKAPAWTERACFTVSDERHVPLEDGQSNFGSAARLWLDPWGIPPARRLPWPVELPPTEAADSYSHQMAAVNASGSYDLCFLGLGDDSHTASLFPRSPLLESTDNPTDFAAVEVPEKGWRLTITPAGLRKCGRFIVMALGAGKAEAIARVFADSGLISEVPARLLRFTPDRVLWLLDEAAAAGL